jgi:curved DNA-binding protein CbpA
MSNYYEILGINPSSDDKAIRQAYLKLSLKYHPDKNPDDPEAAKAKFCAVGQAYTVLSDPSQRAKYDRDLRCGRVFYPNSPQTNSSQEENFENYQDIFDTTVAGMSEEELTVVMSAIGAVAGILGSIVGSHMFAGNSSKGKCTTNGFMETAGSVVGSMVASQLAVETARNLHSKSVERVTYKEEVKKAIARGQPIPKPPLSNNNWDGVLGGIFQSMASVTANNGNSESKSSKSASSSSSDTQERSGKLSWQDKLNAALDGAKTVASNPAAQKLAKTFLEKAAKQQMKKGTK